MSQKIGLMTWYKYCNFGTALQSSAIYHVVKGLGYQPTMINYFRERRYVDKDEMSRSEVIRKGINKVKQILTSKSDISNKRELLFTDYINRNTSETSSCITYPELAALNDEFDAFVCGSDQIWSPLCFDDKYFLSFVNNTRKMVAYAPSIGSSHIDNEHIKMRMKALLKRFHSISVREKQGADIIYQLTDKKAEVVLDPTMLLTSKEWDRIIKSSIPTIKEDYIICYYLGDYKRYSKWVNKLSEVLHMPAYIIPVFKEQDGKKVPFEIGPDEFVSLIKNAKYVCTDSYHGMLFAINYNIPFSIFSRFEENDPKNQNSRVYSLLEILSLKDRLVNLKCLPNSELINTIDFKMVHSIIERWRRKSLDYLINELKRATSTNLILEKNEEFGITPNCCGCGACSVICPKKAVKIGMNKEGFRHYEIDSNLCVNCELCKQVCPMNKVEARTLLESKALYSFKNTDSLVLSKSSSGGAAHTISQLLNGKGYYVCGVMYDSLKREARHEVAEPNNTDKLTIFQGSKYIQSNSAEGIAKTVRLSKSSKVLYFGTPCQTAGLDKVLRKQGSRDNVILVDLICHGVPSDHLLEKYLNDIDKKHGTGKYPTVHFRYGSNKWREIYIYIQGSGHTYSQSEKKDDFYRFFRRSLCYAKSCYECPYREKSAADIRIGDYWGNRFKDDKSGVTMLIVNNNNGEELLNELKEINGLLINQHDLREYWTVQYPSNPSEPLYREELITRLTNPQEDMHSLANEYCNGYDLLELLYRIKNAIAR